MHNNRHCFPTHAKLNAQSETPLLLKIFRGCSTFIFMTEIKLPTINPSFPLQLNSTLCPAQWKVAITHAIPYIPSRKAMSHFSCHQARAHRFLYVSDPKSPW
jgi:hypothetical protein